MGQGARGQERTCLRQQARDWLRADLVLRTKQVGSGQTADRAAVQQALPHWQKDADLAGLRDKDALAKLPAAEQKAFTQLWADVAALLTKAEGNTRIPPGKQFVPAALRETACACSIRE